jgi:hypothetical protein
MFWQKAKKVIHKDNFFKNPWNLVQKAEPRRSRGEAKIPENAERPNWRRLLNKIRTYFKENPEEI